MYIREVAKGQGSPKRVRPAARRDYAALVPRKKSEEDLGQFNIRMPRALLDALDLEVEEHKKQHPGAMFTRSDLIRTILYEHLERAKRKR